jgi:hypothetical protein
LPRVAIIGRFEEKKARRKKLGFRSQGVYNRLKFLLMNSKVHADNTGGN